MQWCTSISSVVSVFLQLTCMLSISAHDEAIVMSCLAMMQNHCCDWKLHLAAQMHAVRLHCIKSVKLCHAMLQEYQQQARAARRAVREEARQAAEEGNAIEPLSAVAQRRLKLNMPHELAGHLRPGAMSCSPHSLQDYQGTIERTQVCALLPCPKLPIRC